VRAALTSVEVRGGWLTRAAIWLRTLPARGRGAPTQRAIFRAADMERGNFVLLAGREPRELVYGLVGRFWTPKGDLVRFAPQEFATIDRAGVAKLAYGFWIEPIDSSRVRLSTATAIWCPEAATRRAMLAYWVVIRPISGLIRREILATVATAAARPLQLAGLVDRGSI
jgi:hypothetical protein